MGEEVSGHPEPCEIGKHRRVVGLAPPHVSDPIRGETVVVSDEVCDFDRDAGSVGALLCPFSAFEQLQKGVDDAD
eukprot:4064191-Heterocapsa_arctica.AAC.1